MDKETSSGEFYYLWKKNRSKYTRKSVKNSINVHKNQICWSHCDYCFMVYAKEKTLKISQKKHHEIPILKICSLMQNSIFDNGFFPGKNFLGRIPVFAKIGNGTLRQNKVIKQETWWNNVLCLYDCRFFSFSICLKFFLCFY